MCVREYKPKHKQMRQSSSVYSFRKETAIAELKRGIDYGGTFRIQIVELTSGSNVTDC